MNSASLATNLLGRPVRLREGAEGAAPMEGSIALIFIDNQGLHFVILVGHELIQVDGIRAFTVLD